VELLKSANEKLKAKISAMKKLNKTYFSLTAVILALLGLSACQIDENSAGYEYMPDMYRSPAIEAYVDYGMDPFHFGDSLAVAQRNTPSARKPVPGTIKFNENPSKVKFNMPYNLPDTEEGYELSANLKTPLIENEAVIARGQELYIKYCKHCHGAKGAGDGKVITVGNHPPPGAYDGALKDLSEGQMFHSITYGKGVMGPHASMVNKEDRWKIVAYIKTLQGKKTEAAAVSEEENTEPAEAVETAETDNQ
jgi:mono/diheme cytochrome c family protein